MSGDLAAGATRRLAAFAAELEPGEIPPVARHAAERLLLDTVACMVGAVGTDVGERVLRWAERLAGPGESSVVGWDDSTGAMAAAYANGRLAALLDADETYPSSRQMAHLAAASVSSALAVGEERHLDGPSLVASVVAGYEVGARVCNSLTPPSGSGGSVLRAGWGPGSVLGATAAAGRAAGLSAAQLRHAFGIAGLHVGPPPLQWTEVRPAPAIKSADAGWHALTAVAAVQQAGLGLTGYDTILDGDRGLWRALGFAGSDDAALTDRIGDRWITLDAALKRWPCQYWMHPALTALDRLLRAGGVAPEDIEQIELATNRKSFSAKFHDPEPPGEVDRAFSFPHAAAMLAARVVPGPKWLENASAARPGVGSLRRRVRVVLHPDADRIGEWVVDHQYRELPASAAVTVGGQTERTEVRFGRGAPWSDESRLSDDELLEKARQMSGHETGTGPLDSLDRGLAALLLVEDVGDVRSILAFPHRRDG